MKKNWKIAGWLIAFALIGTWVQAQATLRPVAQPNPYGASHALVLQAPSDFTGYTSTNTEVVVSNTIPAGRVLAFKGMYLDRAFDDGSAATTNTLTLAVGHGGDADYFMSAQSVASDSTPIYANLGASAAQTYTTDTNSLATAVTPSYVTLNVVTNIATLKDGANVTNVTALSASYVVTTNVAATLTSLAFVDEVSFATGAGTVPYRFASEGYLTASLNPLSGEALSTMTTGKVTLYFLMIK